MYTQSPCSAPSGTTQLPANATAVAQTAGVAAADQNSSPAAAAVQITQTLQSKFPHISHNALWYLVHVGMQAARERAKDLQIAAANRGWWRLMQRQPADFTGIPVQPADIQQPAAAVANNIFHPQAAYQDASVVNAQRSGPECNPDFSDAPEIVDINGGFAYQIPQQKLTTTSGDVVPIPKDIKPLPFTRVR